MPLYDFECSTHGVFEAEFRMADVPQTTECGECNTISERKYGNQWGSVSTSDDPSRFSGSWPIAREQNHFGETGWVDKVETGTGKKQSWEHE